MPNADRVTSRRFTPPTLSLVWTCPKCWVSVRVETRRPAGSMGDRALLCDELQAQLSLRIDEHGSGCSGRMVAGAEGAPL